jgi:hypothetical protein
MMGMHMRDTVPQVATIRISQTIIMLVMVHMIPMPLQIIPLELAKDIRICIAIRQMLRQFILVGLEELEEPLLQQ